MGYLLVAQATAAATALIAPKAETGFARKATSTPEQVCSSVHFTKPRCADLHTCPFCLPKSVQKCALTLKQSAQKCALALNKVRRSAHLPCQMRRQSGASFTGNKQG